MEVMLLKNNAKTDNFELEYGDKIWINAKTWTVEKSNQNTYEVFYGFVVTHISKDQVIQLSDGTYQYLGVCKEPDNPFEEATQYVEGEIN